MESEMPKNLLLVLLIVASSNSQSKEISNIYLGASVALSGYNDDEGSPSKFNVGYNFSENFSVEYNHINLGTSDPFDGSGSLSAKSNTIEILAKYPVNDFSFYAKSGISRWAEQGVMNQWWKESAPNVKIKEKGTDLFLGIGVSYNIIKNLSVKIEYLKLKVNDKSGNPLSFGLDIHF